MITIQGATSSLTSPTSRHLSLWSSSGACPFLLQTSLTADDFPLICRGPALWKSLKLQRAGVREHNDKLNKLMEPCTCCTTNLASLYLADQCLYTTADEKVPCKCLLDPSSEQATLTKATPALLRVVEHHPLCYSLRDSHRFDGHRSCVPP